MMGNIDVETGGSFDYTQKQYGGGPGYGLFQFDFMKSYYYSWLQSHKFSDSEESQIRFVVATLKGDQTNILGAGNAKRILGYLSGNSVEEATKSFCYDWERPAAGKEHYADRLASAKRFYAS